MSNCGSNTDSNYVTLIQLLAYSKHNPKPHIVPDVTLTLR